jgi:hypothetical protein
MLQALASVALILSGQLQLETKLLFSQTSEEIEPKGLKLEKRLLESLGGQWIKKHLPSRAQDS